MSRPANFMNLAVFVARPVCKTIMTKATLFDLFQTLKSELKRTPPPNNPRRCFIIPLTSLLFLVVQIQDCLTWIVLDLCFAKARSTALLGCRRPACSRLPVVCSRTTFSWFKSKRQHQDTKKPPFWVAFLYLGCLTWIRTTINGVRVRCPTIRR